VALSEDERACIVERAGMPAQARTANLRDQIRHSVVVQSDETGARVDGRIRWTGVFIGGTLVPEVTYSRPVRPA
jgi:hypothetical protein